MPGLTRHPVTSVTPLARRAAAATTVCESAAAPHMVADRQENQPGDYGKHYGGRKVHGIIPG